MFRASTKQLGLKKRVKNLMIILGRRAEHGFGLLQWIQVLLTYLESCLVLIVLTPYSHLDKGLHPLNP